MKLNLRRQARWPFTPGAGADQHLGETLRILRTKWGEVPHGEQTRARSEDLLRLSDDELLKRWAAALADSSSGDAYSVRGWYHTLYRDIFRGKKVLEIGSGLGFDGITFAAAGAEWTFVDIVQSNLAVVERLCKLQNVSNVRFCYMDDLRSIDLGTINRPWPITYALANSMFNRAAAMSMRLEVGAS